MRYWIDLCEAMESDGFLYHTATQSELESITRYGLRPGTFWCNKAIAEYYAEFLKKEGDEPLIIRAPISVFTESMLSPNAAALKAPITEIVGFDTQTEWEQSDKTWKNCLDIVGSIRYRATMPLPPAEVMT